MSDVSEKISTVDSTHTITTTVEIPIIPISKNVANLNVDNSKVSDVVDVGIITLGSDHKGMPTINDPDRTNANKAQSPVNGSSTVDSSGPVTIEVAKSDTLVKSEQKPASAASAPDTATVTTTTMVNIVDKNSESKGNCLTWSQILKYYFLEIN